LIWHDETLMKNTLTPTICAILLASCSCFGRHERLANHDLSGLYARSIERILRLREDEVDLATAVLIISEEWNDNVLGRRYISRVDEMAWDILDRLKAKGLKSDYKAIPVINDYLFKENRFKSVKEAADPRDLFLHSVMDRKSGYCLSLSVLYLSIGERLGLPLYGVVVPGHFFVRYDDGKRTRFNIETTSGGGSAPDEHYLTKFNVPEGGREGIYMKNLNKMQTLGCFFNNLGNSYMDVGNLNSALMALERAVEINPSLAESRTNLGNIYLRKGQIQDAISQYSAALRINPHDAKTHNNLGNTYARQNMFTNAVSEYHKSIELDPNFVDAYKNLANAYCKQSLFSKAVHQLKAALDLEPRNAELYTQLGEVYSETGDCETALAQYERAVRIDRDSARSHYGMALCYKKLGRIDHEIRAYKNALRIEPDMTAALGNLGNAYFGKENYDEAIRQYQKALRIAPDDGMLYYNLGAAYSNKGAYSQAVTAYLKAVRIDPQDANSHNGLGFAYYRLEKYDEAWSHIQTAEQLGVAVDKDLIAAVKRQLK